MPVEQRSRISQLTGIGIALGAVLLAVGASWLLLRLASGGDGPVRIQLGDEDFDAGQVERIATQIAEEGPVLYSDVSGRGQRQPIWVNHFGDDAKTQWYVFSAVAPGAEEGCFLAWNEERNLFEERRPDPEDPRAEGELCRDVVFSATGEPESGSTDAPETFTWSVDDEDNLIIEVVQRDEADSDESDSGD
ncbi:MAG: hypothetical protein KDB31_09555 [Microthrixaceae bacterium]|nr:hypothetical protein [Microthrixaceae bacterium]